MPNKEQKRCDHCSCNEKDKSLKAVCPVHSTTAEKKCNCPKNFDNTCMNKDCACVCHSQKKCEHVENCHCAICTCKKCSTPTEIEYCDCGIPKDKHNNYCKFFKHPTESTTDRATDIISKVYDKNLSSPTKPDREKICEKNCPDYSGMESFHKEQCDCSCHKPDTEEWGKELMEKLADIEHERWADWQKHCHQMIDVHAGKIPEPFKSRWELQINTPYSELSEEDKEKDREQVRRYFHLIRQEKEKSYEQGSEDAHIQIYEVHSEAEREIGRHSAYREIIEEIEKSNRFPAYDNSIEAEAYMAGVNEFKAQIISKLKEKLTQK